MAYETGSASGPQNLLDRLAIFATTNGWTENKNTTDASSNRWVSLYKAGVGYFNLYADNDDVYLRGATGYDSGQQWDTQPGTSSSTRSNNMAGPYVSYHFFENGTYLHAVVEVATGNYRHIVLGTASKFCSFVGGEYIGAVFWAYGSTYTNYPWEDRHNYLFDSESRYGGYHHALRSDIDGQTSKWFYCDRNRGNADQMYAPQIRSGFQGRYIDRTPNTFNLLPVLIPIYVGAGRGDGNYSLLGNIPDIRYINMRLLQPGDVLTIGADQWHIFPVIQKTDSWQNYNSTTPSSANYGLAYRKVV